MKFKTIRQKNEYFHYLKQRLAMKLSRSVIGHKIPNRFILYNVYTIHITYYALYINYDTLYYTLYIVGMIHYTYYTLYCTLYYTLYIISYIRLNSMIFTYYITYFCDFLGYIIYTCHVWDNSESFMLHISIYFFLTSSAEDNRCKP